MNVAARERLRKQYRPDRVRILFVGESPPASGRFFYQADSGLYRAIRDGFLAAFQDLPETDFLGSFRNLGCYLVDLCGEPVDRLDRRDRDAACRAGVPRLSRIIRELKPEIIVVVVRSIVPHVAQAQSRGEWSGATFELPYPGRWHKHREAFVEALIPVLRSYV
jgi:hypothetical protein